MKYYIKALYAGAVGALGSLSGALAVLPDATLTDLPDAVWITVALFFLAGFGGVLGWQVAPATVSASVRPPPDKEIT